MSAALILVGMSVREVDARDGLLALARELAGDVSDAENDVSVAFLQLGDPSLGRELSRLADAGAESVELVGVSLGSLAPAASWLRRIAAHWWRERAGHRPSVEVATRLLSSLDPAALDECRRDRRTLTGAEPGLTSAAWESVTRHRHQVLVCRGPRCTALGSDRTAEALILELMAHGVGDDDVLITHTGCQFPCNQAPVVSVQPDDVWYGSVDPATARRIAADHLVAGRPLDANLLERVRRPD